MRQNTIAYVMLIIALQKNQAPQKLTYETDHVQVKYSYYTLNL